MSSEAYKGDFTCWADVQNAFETDTPEPEEVILAHYEVGGYEGSATVIYRNGDTYYVVEGAHCSCHGLEDQFDPEPYDKPTFAAMAVKRWLKDGVDD